MGEIVDLTQAQGMVAGQIYGYVPDPPWGPPHQCPGCQPRPDKPDLAQLWDRWQALEMKLRKLGESPSCPIARSETLPASYTNAERVARGGIQTDRMPRYEPRPVVVIEPPAAAELPVLVPQGNAPVATEVASQAPKEEPTKPQRKTPTKRTPKPQETPKGQRILF